MASTRTFLLLIALALASALVAAALVAASGEPTDGGNGSPLGDGVLETDGDWVVETGATLSYTNKTIIINGNLTVSVGGTLSLKGSALVVNITDEHPMRVTVEPSGTLIVEDYDGDAMTDSDRGSITSFWSFNRFPIEVHPGGVLRVTRSTLSNLGSPESLGLHVRSDGVTLEDAVVSEFDSVFSESANPSFVRVSFKGSEDSALYFLSSGATLENCSIDDCFSALNVRGNPAPAVTGVTITNCFVAINVESADMTVRGGLLRVAAFGSSLRLDQSSHLTLVDVEFDEDVVDFRDNSSSYETRWTLTLTVIDQEGMPVEAAAVVVNDTRGQTVWEGATGADGTLHVEVRDRVRTNASTEGSNPHTVTVRKDRYRAIDVVSITAPTDHELRLTTNLAPVIEVNSPRQNTRVVMGQPLLLDATGSRDPNGDPLTYRWTTDLGGRVLYEGPLPSVSRELLLGEAAVILAVSDGLGGVNTTTIPVVVLQATVVTLTLTEPQYNVTLRATYGGTGTLVLDKAEVSPPYGADLLGVFVQVHAQGDVVFASGTLSIRYASKLLPFGMNESTLHIAIEDAGLWLEAEGSTVDEIAHTTVAPISRMGVYAVRGVIPPNVPPRLLMHEAGASVQPHDVEARVGSPVELLFVAEDELPAFAMLDVAGLPQGLLVDRSTKRVWGTMPPEQGSWQLRLTLTDSGGLTATATIWLNATGEMPAPQMWSALVEPTKGDTETVFEAKVLYRSDLNIPPEYVAVVIDGKRYDLVQVDPTDTDWVSGVMFHTFLMLDQKGDPYEVVFNASDGTRTNVTEPIELEVGWPDFSPTSIETAVILATIAAIIVLIAVIRLTSRRYNELRTAHIGKDKEDSIEYIRPERKKGGGDGPGPGDEAKGGDGTSDPDGVEVRPPPEPDKAAPAAYRTPSEEVAVVRPPEGPPPGEAASKRPVKDAGSLDEEVERLDEELDKLDEEIDGEEETLSKLDEDIEGIIDELENDKKRAR